MKTNSIKTNPSRCRRGCKDIWNAFMCEGATFGPHDIPLCLTTAIALPKKLITWTEAKAIYKKSYHKDKDFHYDAYICFYEDDHKFDGKRSSIWMYPGRAYKIICHFAGIISPDFSTYQDFPYPIKIFNTYRMRAFGCWLGKNGKPVINNVRWGTEETWSYCWEGIPQNSIVAIGTVGGSPRKKEDRHRFETGIYEMVKMLSPHTIVVYGSATYPCFDELRKRGIRILVFESKTAIFFSKRGDAS